ncbi:substrate-binding periplasmic protein [Pseudoalteromonas carrageenovora]|uniref:substrate-binding periplasmic protein n=1 Tax=Pseudoalteromonas carrageenovora TaxID=227 RepID=UPI0026E3C40F|nr:transporter substrate-binding domain-containing protein [Pseudoalteromonas carrageenovora]MDO6463500.1 transporter substrate-binding domain-containing protein [Pseudoalteromonas carrageenovora]MDO6634870.1 transporter substrate-binding domain-containing protein [Pseudoalteromonas carrageenovora]MDO6649559.1 transporter substrate-binding domain-containing protein [Pseudoalteromonas carrageenovora]
MKYTLYFLCLVCSFFANAKDSYLVVTELAPPNQVLVDGQVMGPSTELIREIFKNAKLSPDIRMYPWARAYKVARELKNTFIYSLARTPEREDKFYWIAPIGHFKLGFIALSERDDIHIKNTQQAKSYKIAMQRNDFSTQTLMELGFNVVLTSDIQKSYNLLLAKKVDLIVDDPLFMRQMSDYLKLDPEYLKFVYKVDELTVDAYLAANKKTDINLVNALQKSFLQIKQRKGLAENH